MLYLMRTLVFILFIINVLCLTVEDEICISANNKSLNNNFLIGTWYEIYEVGTHIGMPRSQLCRRQIFTKLSKREIDFFKYMFKILHMKTDLVNPVYVRDSHNKSFGVLSGGNEGKMFSTDPKSLIWREENEEGRVYTCLNDNLILWRQCEHNFTINFILSRSKNAEDEEVIRIVNNFNEIKNMGKHMRCLLNST